MVNVCDGCGNSVRYILTEARDYYGYGNDPLFCANCVTECGWCEYAFRDIADHYYRCSECGDGFCPDADYNWCDECESRQCESCYCTECESASVRPYHYRPHYMPKGVFGKGNPLLGVELEVGGDTRTIVDVVHRFDDSEHHVYMKHDGSIVGVEVVTHPMTLDYAQAYPFARMVDMLATEGCYVEHPSMEYGLHVHVSRNGFYSPIHAMRWLMFIYRNECDITNRIARRYSEEWAPFNEPMRGELRNKAISPSHDSRYAAVNCTGDRTYELRFSAATLKPSEFYASIEFAHASVVYTSTLSVGDMYAGGALSWDMFAEWVAERENTYPALAGVSVDPRVAERRRSAAQAWADAIADMAADFDSPDEQCNGWRHGWDNWEVASECPLCNMEGN